MGRFPAYEEHARILTWTGLIAGVAALGMHADILLVFFSPDRIGSLTLSAAVSLVSLQLALIALVGALNPSLRGMSAALLVFASLLALPMHTGAAPTADSSFSMTWQTEVHVLVAMFSYSLLTAGAIVAAFALVQERRLKAGRVLTSSHLFAPLITTERLLYGITTVGFVGLALAVVSGLTFVKDLFAQHLIHKSVFSISALVIFGTLLAGRTFAGWRGRRAIYLYLGGFALLVLAYFGSRFILEQILNRSWG
ncbi:MAG: cytochrome c biogenesis protein CcsA [Woeseiaceae bacterium]|jgi:ABC-type uncharacterized transport system permease subunit|nr:cytochrome c biogenesis protein CcsA [Woeseiaceae bacterium]